MCVPKAKFLKFWNTNLKNLIFPFTPQESVYVCMCACVCVHFII